MSYQAGHGSKTRSNTAKLVASLHVTGSEPGKTGRRSRIWITLFASYPRATSLGLDTSLQPRQALDADSDRRQGSCLESAARWRLSRNQSEHKHHLSSLDVNFGCDEMEIAPYNPSFLSA